MVQSRSGRLVSFSYSIALLCGLAVMALAASCLPDSRGDTNAGRGSACFTEVDCPGGEEYCKAEDPSVSPEGLCEPLVGAGGACLLGSHCVSGLFCLVDNTVDEGVCRAAPASCQDGPACNCDPMLEMCAPDGLSCDGVDDSVTLHCNNGLAGSGIGDDDDDDTVGGDDDTAGDDDTSSGFSFTGLTFALEMTATPGSTGAAGVAATYKFSYWADYQNQVIECHQSIDIEGSAVYGAGIVSGCTNCTGSITFDASTATDTSASQPEDPCDVAELDAIQANFGSLMLTSITNGGYGDFLSIGLVDATTMGALGLDLAVAGGYTSAEIDTALADYGFVFTHAGYVDNQTGSLSDTSGLSAVASNAGSGSSWYGYWQIFTNPSTNTFVGADLSGLYGAQAVWVITFTADP